MVRENGPSAVTVPPCPNTPSGHLVQSAVGIGSVPGNALPTRQISEMVMGPVPAVIVAAACVAALLSPTHAALAGATASKLVLGIDLGTTFSCVGVWKDFGGDGATGGVLVDIIPNGEAWPGVLCCPHPGPSRSQS